MKCLPLLAILLVSFSAAAGDPGAWFRKLDRNQDGYLDRKELAGQHRVLAVFDQADENGDGKLTPEEFIKAEALAQEARRRPTRAEPAKKGLAPG
jgi:EF hand domain-containing protein